MTNQSSQQLQLKKKEPMTETWKNVPGYGGVYQASSLGTLRTHNWKNKGVTRIMLPAQDANGYLRTVLVNPLTGKYKTIKVHRIVALTWIGNPENKPEINHKNGIKNDNCIENLEWCTHRENFDHSVVNGLQPGLFKEGALNRYAIAVLEGRCEKVEGSKVGTSKLTETQVIEIRNKFKPRIHTREMLAQEYGVKASCIKDVICRKSWKHI